MTNVFNIIKERISILDVVSQYANLKKAGGYWKGRCPFHHEKTASFTVSPHRSIFYCFGCHAGGDVITFITKVENCTPLEAAKSLAERHGIELPDDWSAHEDEQSAQVKHDYFNLCTLVSQWCQEQLRKNPSVMRYLKNRGFGDQSINYFSIGYFPGGLHGVKALIEAMKRKNILPRDLIDAHIINEGKTVMYSPFEERIIFPIKDQVGNYCGFGGRIYKDGDTRPKYYNSRENDYFAKGSLLFGLDLARKAIQQDGSVFLVEGYTDCIAMAQHGFANVVATLGTACTAQHLKTLSRHAQQLYVLYDNDSAGRQAVLRLTQLCWQANMDLSVITLPQGLDPASFLQNNGDLKALIADAKDIFSFFVSSLGDGFAKKTLTQKLTLTRQLIDVALAIEDPVKQDLLLTQAAEHFGVSREALRAELDKAAAKAQQYGTSKTEPEMPPLPQEMVEDVVPVLEKKIFCAIVNNIELFNDQNEKYLITYMPSPLRDILERVRKARGTDGDFDFDSFFNELDDPHKRYVSKLLLENEDSIEPNAFERLLLQLQRRQWKVIVRTIQRELAHAQQENNESRIREILHDFSELKQRIVPTISRN